MIKYDMTRTKELYEQKIKSLVSRLTEVEKRIPVVFLQPPEDPRSASYIKAKEKILNKVGLKSITVKPAVGANQEDMYRLILSLGAFKIPTLVQLPMPEHLFQHLNIKAASDVDRIFPEAKTELSDVESYRYLQPCTVRGIIEIMNLYFKDMNKELLLSKYCYNGVVVTVIGRGELVGRPLVRLLQDLGATVIQCNRNTPRPVMKSAIEMSDIVISAVGKHGVIDSDMFEHAERNPLIIDAGVDFINGKLHGDLKLLQDHEVKAPNVKYTPHIGGVGPMTVLSVAYNTAILLSQYHRNVTDDVVDTAIKLIESLKKSVEEE